MTLPPIDEARMTGLGDRLLTILAPHLNAGLLRVSDLDMLLAFAACVGVTIARMPDVNREELAQWFDAAVNAAVVSARHRP
jgi:hypothetical protein